MLRRDASPTGLVSLIPWPLPSIMNEGANTLCLRCHEIDLSPFLSREDHLDCWPRGRKRQFLGEVKLGSLDSIFDRASTCNVCKMFCDTLEDIFDADELIEKRRGRRRVNCCTLFWSEHGRACTRADLSYCQPPVESIFRMDIGMWYDANGRFARCDNPNLRNLFQPAPWPVPRLEAAREPSQFWNTLRNGRLRSPICEPRVLRT